MRITDGTHQTPAYSDKENGIPFLSSKDVTSGKINWSGIKYITKELHEELYKRIAPQRNDILLAKNGTTGVAALVDDDTIFDIYVTLAVIRPSLNVIYPPYLLYQINSPFCKEQFNNHLTGIGLPNLHLCDINKTRITLPPLAEQKRIVIELERWLTVIDSLENNNQDLLQIVAQTKSKILDLAIHGKLVAQDPNDEPASELLRRIASHATPCDTSHYENLPQGWAVTSMHNLCRLTEGEKQDGIAHLYLDVKYLRGKSDGETMTSGKYVPANSTMILVDGENSGEIFTTPFEGYQGSTFKLLDISDEVYKPFILYVIRSYQKQFREHKVGSAIPHLNKKLFKEISVLIPPFEEQKRIVARIEDIFSSLQTISAEL